MRPRGRGDDDFDDDDEFDDVSPPPQSVLDAEADAEAVPEEEAEADPEPEPAPQPTRAPLSSLVVRPPPQDNGASSASPARSSSYPAGDASGRRRGSSLTRRRRDISPPDPRGRERRRSPPPPPARRLPGSPPLQRRRLSPPGFQPRPQRFYDEPQEYAIYASPSPPRQRRLESSNYDDTIGPRYNHGYQGSGRGGPRFRDGSPPYGRGGRSHGRGYNNAPAPAPAPGKDFIIIDGEYVHRNDPNLSPRAGDWICQNPSCGNLNFARRTHCNNCNKNRYESSRSPHRGYFDSPPRGPPRALGPPSDHAPLREMPKYRPPPRDWVGGDPRGYAARSPPVRARRFPPDLLQRDRMGFRGDTELRDRAKYEWSAAEEYKQRERPHDGFYLDRSRRQSVSPRGNWGSDMRDRSRSPAGNRPMKGTFAGRGRPDLDYSGSYVGRGRSNTLDAGRGRVRGCGRGYRPGGDPFSGEGRGDYRPGGDPYPGEGRDDRRAAPRGRIEGRY